MHRIVWALIVLATGWPCCTSNAQDDASPERWPVVFQSDFSRINRAWESLDPDSWKVEDGRLQLFQKASDYSPPFRSPLHITLLRTPSVADFVMDVRVRSTHEHYNHRDVCLFFGYQDPSRYYYVHLGQQTDPRANQIFIVNEADRTKISLTTTEGTPWDEDWHHVRLVRDSRSGDIRVYFDDMQTPVMTANDRTFVTGRVGLGSFDDTADFDDLSIRSPQSTINLSDSVPATNHAGPVAMSLPASVMPCRPVCCCCCFGRCCGIRSRWRGWCR
ncbi:MAG: hypothetical protein ACR2NP_02880 [Pirellulaceae bacterium]